MGDNYSDALAMAKISIKRKKEESGKVILHRDEIRAIVEDICQISFLKNIDKQSLINAISQSEVQAGGYGKPQILEIEYKKWLRETGVPYDTKRELTWKYWADYQAKLEDNPGFADYAAKKVARESIQILMRLQDPLEKGRWYRKGMVVADVQSGKTANYNGLIARAVDTGYKLIIVIAGMTNNLRLQTQQRIDSDFIGYDTEKDINNEYKERIGVGNNRFHKSGKLTPAWLTYANEDGDFDNRAITVGTPLPPPNPTIIVIKKHTGILENVITWIKRNGLEEGMKSVPDCPVLLIDDECDFASINTAIKKGEDPDKFISATNRLLRTLLNLFDQKCYIGYTATPYANILINREADTTKYGPDLFPDNFIYYLERPPNYIGPEKVFGTEEFSDARIPGRAGFPIFHEIKSREYSKGFVHDKHKKDLKIVQLPGSLKNAIRTFILACATRSKRGQDNQHNSMLIHVTRFILVQGAIVTLVQEEVESIRSRFLNGDPSIRKELEGLWSGFMNVSDKMNELGQVHEYDEIEPFIAGALNKLESVKGIYGKTGDLLEYKQNKKFGINVIAIGGDKLSRGLTLEGLTVSYYLRASKMYDTLMQMGRWFGYRDGYADLCRIYTTKQLKGWYQFISSVNEELAGQFKYMVDNPGFEPKDYGMKIRSHAGVLNITGMNKRRLGEKWNITFSEILVQTMKIHLSEQILIHNHDAVDRLFKGQDIEPLYTSQKGTRKSLGYGYTGVNNYHDIISFLKDFRFHPLNGTGRSEALINYITKLTEKHGELVHWKVAIMSPGGGICFEEALPSISHPINRTERTEPDIINSDDTAYLHVPKTIQSPSHEQLGLNEEELQKWKSSNDSAYWLTRQYRNAQTGFLYFYLLSSKTKNDDNSYGWDNPVLGFAMSFPRSNHDTKIEYIVDQKYMEHFDGDE